MKASDQPAAQRKFSEVYKYSLILIYRPEPKYRSDFEEITSRIRQIAPDILTVHGNSANTEPLPNAVWMRPTLIVSFLHHFSLKLKRGKLYRAGFIEKELQAKMFEFAKVPTPKTEVFAFGKQLDEADWGSFVILKPCHATSQGRGIHLVRTARIGQLTIDDFPDPHPIRKDTYLVQSFVDTGEFPTSFRVLTLFGEPLYCRRNFRLQPRPELTSDDTVLFDSVVATNAGVGPGMTSTELVKDAEVIEFARRMHSAAAHIPLLGCDILREVDSGKLYALELNAGGNTWAFSSRLGEKARAILGETALVDQFGAWDVAARVLANKTRQEAL